MPKLLRRPKTRVGALLVGASALFTFTMIPRNWTCFFLCIICFFLGALVTRDTSPKIVVNMPKDARPLAELEKNPTLNISEEKAVLWWTVFKCLADKGYTASAMTAADKAVLTVYGPHSSRK